MTPGSWLIWAIFVLAVLAFVVRGVIGRPTSGGAMWTFVAIAGALLTWFLIAAVVDILDQAPAAPAWQIPIYLLVGVLGLIGALLGMWALREPMPPSQKRVEREREEEGLERKGSRAREPENPRKGSRAREPEE